MSSLTISEVLAMPLLRRSRPVVLAGEDRLDQPVRWVHATELAEIVPLLSEGDLVLSTGIALPGAPAELADFAASLRDVGAVTLMLELGRRWTVAPPALVDACRTLSLPLVSVAHEVRFAAITQAVGERIVDDQPTELRDAERIHETFTELSLAEAGPSEILAEVQRLSGPWWCWRASTTGCWTTWPARGTSRTSSRIGRADRGRCGRPSGPCGTSGTGACSPGSGRRPGAGGGSSCSPPRDRRSGWSCWWSGRPLPWRCTGCTTGTGTTWSAGRRRSCRGRWEPATRRRTCSAAAISPVSRPHAAGSRHWSCGPASEPAGRPRRASGRCPRDCCRWSCTPPTSSASRPGGRGRRRRPGAAVPGPAGRADDLVETLARQALRQTPGVAGAGRVAPDAASVDRTLREAQQVVDAVPEAADPAGRLVHRLEDVHLRGLLSLLGEDDRVRLFVARELDALRTHDGTHGTALLGVLRALVEHPRSKSDAAAALHLSRPAFYARLAASVSSSTPSRVSCR